MWSASVIFLGAVLAELMLPQVAPPRVKPGDLKRFVGKEVTVCGRVVTYDCEEAHQTMRLDLDQPYWSGNASIGVRAADTPAFGARFEDGYLGANVCGTGTVERLERRYVVIVSRPEALVGEPRKGMIPPPFAPGAAQQCVPGVEKPVLVREVKPRYTAAAMQAGIQGRVLLDAVVLPDGTIGAVRILYSLDRGGLDQEGVAALRQWRFRPGTINGRVVPMIVAVEMSFRLK